MIGLTALIQKVFKKHNERKGKGNNSSFWKESFVADDKVFIVPFHRQWNCMRHTWIVSSQEGKAEHNDGDRYNLGIRLQV
jgi:hypothetical protein